MFLSSSSELELSEPEESDSLSDDEEEDESYCPLWCFDFLFFRNIEPIFPYEEFMPSTGTAIGSGKVPGITPFGLKLWRLGNSVEEGGGGGGTAAPSWPIV